MFSKLFLLLISTITSCLNYAELPARCADCLDPNGNAEMTNFLKPNSSWICSGECLTENEGSGELTVDYFSIKSYIKHRYATTYVTSQFTNGDIENQTAEFSIFIPSRAHITRFTIQIDGQIYDSKIDKRQKRSERKPGRTGHEGNPLRKFGIKRKLKPNSRVTYHLVYEELLARKNGKYSVNLNVHPGQVTKHLDVQVLINENQPLRFVKTPSLINPGDLEKNIEALNPQAEFVYKNQSSVIVKFRPTPEQQVKFMKALNETFKYGLNVQFRVNYDVQHYAPGGEVVIKGQYFVHYFAPEHLKPLPKHVIFVLDTSGSMKDVRIEQLKLSMEKILPQLKPDDLFSIIEFASNVFVVDVKNKAGTKKIIKGSEINDYGNIEKILRNKTIPAAVKATKANIDEAIKRIKGFRAGGHTNMISSLQLALYMVKQTQKAIKIQHEPIIMFITDGEPTFRKQTKAETVKIVTKYNANIASIFSVAISVQAHYPFLKQLSALNRGTALYIENSQDISVLLKRFFDVYSTPVLNNIRFLYGINATTLTKTRFATFYEGTELVVAGKIENLRIQPHVVAKTQQGEVQYLSYVSQSTTSLDRIWAYLKTSHNIYELTSKNVTDQVVTDTLNLALEYSFVTPLSSLHIDSTSFGTINDDLLLRPTYEPIKDLSSIKVKQSKVHRFILPIDLSNKKKMINKKP